jgi:hypothetical protein
MRSLSPAVKQSNLYFRDARNDNEMKYILACLNTELDCVHHPCPTDHEVDWGRLLTLLRRNSLAGHFYVIRKKCPDHWPTWFKEELRQDHYGLLLYGDYCIVQVKKVLTRLIENGVEIIVLKGWSLIPTIYDGDYSQRFCNDIDILVHPRDIEKTMAILENTGWKAELEKRPGFSNRYYNARTYHLGNHPGVFGLIFGIGVHWGLLHHPAYNPKQITIEDLFTRAHGLEVAGVQVGELSIEDQIIYGCAHLDLHHRNEITLNRFYEIAAIIVKKGQGINWTQILYRAGKWQLISPLLNVLKEVDHLWNGIIPASIIVALEDKKITPYERITLWWNKRVSPSDSSDLIFSWIMMSGVKRKIGFFLENLFPEKTYMIRYYGPAPSGIWVLLYLLRITRKLHQLFHKSLGKSDV